MEGNDHHGGPTKGDLIFLVRFLLRLQPAPIPTLHCPIESAGLILRGSFVADRFTAGSATAAITEHSLLLQLDATFILNYRISYFSGSCWWLESLMESTLVEVITVSALQAPALCMSTAGCAMFFSPTTLYSSMLWMRRAFDRIITRCKSDKL